MPDNADMEAIQAKVRRYSDATAAVERWCSSTLAAHASNAELGAIQEKVRRYSINEAVQLGRGGGTAAALQEVQATTVLFSACRPFRFWNWTAGLSCFRMQC